MAETSNRSRIPGSERIPLAGSHVVGAPDPDERIQITISVRPRTSIDQVQSKINEINALLPNERKYLTPTELEAMRGASQEDLERIKTFARVHNLEVVEESALKRTIILEGSIASMSSAFGVTLNNYEYSGGRYRGRTGPVHVPEEIASIVQGVHGLDNRPQFRPRHRMLMQSEKRYVKKPDMLTPAEAIQPFSPIKVAKLYNFPTELNGKGQCIGIIELGGGFGPKELDTYFGKLGIGTPNVSSVSVGNGQNNPGADTGDDGEVMLDIEVAAVIAPGARTVVYFSAKTTNGFLDAVKQAIHDTENNPSVISISWGASEDISGTDQIQESMNQAFQDAALLGKTICCASGDQGASDERLDPQGIAAITDNLAHVDFPASSPFVLACGGTRLISSNGSISTETVWNDGIDSRTGISWASGGGVSDKFSRPDYQLGLNIPPSVNGGGFDGRGVPDVSGIASPGYDILVDEQESGIGGTSAVAPLWAGLIALINQALDKPVGFLNQLLYKHLGPAGIFRDVTTGDNIIKNVRVKSPDNGSVQTMEVKGYKSQPGWDACTGWGSPDGEKLLKALKGS